MLGFNNLPAHEYPRIGSYNYQLKASVIPFAFNPYPCTVDDDQFSDFQLKGQSLVALSHFLDLVRHTPAPPSEE